MTGRPSIYHISVHALENPAEYRQQLAIISKKKLYDLCNQFFSKDCFFCGDQILKFSGRSSK